MQQPFWFISDNAVLSPPLFPVLKSMCSAVQYMIAGNIEFHE